MNIIEEFDTIAAISTPIGTGGVGVIRISGDKSFDIAKQITNRSDFRLVEFATAGLLIIIKNWRSYNSSIQNPNSYTGEDVIEVHCHGGINVVRNVLDIIIKNGARMAERGEFTKRAFLNKKLDLSQAEAVDDIIHAKHQILQFNLQKFIRCLGWKNQRN